MKTIYLRIITLILCIGLQIIVFAQGPDCCDRHAMIKSCTADDPMNITSSMDAYCPSVKATLAERLSRDCFHFLYGKTVEAYRERANREGWGSIVKPSNVPDHEYSFDVDFVSGLDEYNDSGRPVRSRLSVKMYFEGEQRELVYQWNTEGTWDPVSNSGTTWLGHGFKLERAFKDAPDIIEIIERFEKRPVDFEISPDRNDINAGEIIEFELTGFKDIFGETSREFNRIVVHAYEGDILNGDVCNIGPEYRVFRLNEGSVNVKYQAPSDCDVSSDRFTVYSSCDILPLERVPLEETDIRERIVEKEFRLNCYDASVRIHKTYDKELNTSDSDQKTDKDGCTITGSGERHVTESIEATITLSLKLDNIQEMPIFSQTWEYYKPMSVNLTGFNYTSIENQSNSSAHTGSGCAQVSQNTNVDISRQASDYKITEKSLSTQVYWVLVLDSKTGAGLKLIPAGYGIDYDIHETQSIKFVITSKEGTSHESSSTSSERSTSFELGPVAEEKVDPTIKTSDTWIQDYLKDQGVQLPAGIEIPTPSNAQTIKKIHPDILVKYGDGVSSLGGDGDRLIEKELDNGKQEERLHYSWNMTRNRKNQ